MARKRLCCSCAAKLPLNSDPQWIHDIYGFLLAVFSFTIVYGAFAANTFYGAMNLVPQSQIETGKSWNVSETDIHQYHLSTDVEVCTSWPIKPLDVINKINTPTFLLGIQDVVYWARELGDPRPQYFNIHIRIGGSGIFFRC